MGFTLIRVLFVLLAIFPWILLIIVPFEAQRETDFPVGLMILWLALTPLSFVLSVSGPILFRLEKRAVTNSMFWSLATAFAAGPLCVGILLTALGYPR